jgi:hypothetical protein
MKNHSYLTKQQVAPVSQISRDAKTDAAVR